MSGFGVSDGHWAVDLFHLPPAIRGRVVAMLFSPIGLDLGAYRYTIGGGQGGDWFLRQAAEHGIRNITAYANSAPGRFTTNGRTCGGWLRPNDVDTYASYLTNIVAHLYDAEGVTVSSVSPMNEPDWSFPRCFQDGMHVGIADRAALVQALGRDLAARAPYAGVVGDESSHLVSQLLPEASQWLDRSGVAQNLKAITYHDYGPGPPDLGALEKLVALEHRYEKPAWMTEICCENGHTFGPGYDPSMQGALWMADRMWMDLSLGDAASFDWWRALSPSIGCAVASDPACATRSNAEGWDDGLLYYDPAFARDGDHHIFTSKRYDAFGNISRYVRPGAVRWPVDGSTYPLKILAFSSRDTSTVVVVDDSTEARTLRLQLSRSSGERLVPATSVRTSLSENLSPVSAPKVDQATASLTAAIPPRSVTTLVLDRRPVAAAVHRGGAASHGLGAEIAVVLVAALGLIGLATLSRRRRSVTDRGR